MSPAGAPAQLRRAGLPDPARGRRPRRLAALTLAALLAAAPTTGRGQEPAPAPPSCVHELVYTPFAGLILIAVTIGDSPPMDFILDSGATQSAVTDPLLAAALGLEVREAGLARGIGAGATRVLIADHVSIRADGVELLEVSLAVHDIGVRLAELSGRDIHGFLGAELFERYVVEIDPASRRVLLHDPQAFFHPGGGAELPLTVENKRPVVEGRVTLEEGGKALPVRLMVDTGSSRSLTLISGSRRQLKLPAGSTPSASVGVVGETTVQVATSARLELGRVVSERIETSWVGAHQVPAVRNIPKLNGIVGNGLLARLRVVFDYARGRLILGRPS